MKIKAEESRGKSFNIVIPSWLVFNPIMATFLCGAANRAIQEKHTDNKIKLTPKQMRVLFKCIRVAAKQLKKDDLPLVEVVSENGENVEIIL